MILDIPFAPEVIRDGETGLLAGEKDVEGLVAKLTWLIDNPEKWDEMVSAGRNHVEKEYDARVQGVRLAAIYQEVLSS